MENYYKMGSEYRKLTLSLERITKVIFTGEGHVLI